MPYSTSVIAVDPATNVVQEYANGGVTRVPGGSYNVVYGVVTNVPSGTNIPVGGPWLVLAGSMTANDDGLQLQRVTVTPA